MGRLTGFYKAMTSWKTILAFIDEIQVGSRVRILSKSYGEPAEYWEEYYHLSPGSLIGSLGTVIEAHEGSTYYYFVVVEDLLKHNYTQEGSGNHYLPSDLELI